MCCKFEWKAETAGKIELVSQANAKRQIAKEKQEQVSEL